MSYIISYPKLRNTNNSQNVVVDNSNNGAFGDQIVSEISPRIQETFLYGLDTRKFSVTGFAQVNNAMLEVSTSPSASVKSTVTSKKILKYRAGQGVTIMFTGLFATPTDGSNQMIGFIDDQDGLAFACKDSVFGILIRRDAVETFIPQTEWNQNKLDGSNNTMLLDVTKFNVFKISMQYLGAGAIYFYIEDSDDGKLKLVHLYQYANKYVQSSLRNPTLAYRVECENTTNTTNLVTKSISFMGAIEGKAITLGEYIGKSNSKLAVGTTETNILTIRCENTFFSEINKSYIKICLINLATDGNKNAEVKIIRNAGITTPSFTTITDTYVGYDTTGTYTPGTGYEIIDLTLSKIDKELLYLDSFELFLAPNDTISIIGNFINAGSGDITACITVQEDS